MISVLEPLLRMRQAYVSETKLMRIVEQLEEAQESGQRVLVSSQWTSVLDRLEERLQNTLPAPQRLRLDGASQNRGEMVSEFQSGNADALLMSLKAEGVGITLTSADQVILVDPWWNPFAEDQAVDRAHRIEQDKPVLITSWIVEHSVEERILNLQSSKRQMAQERLLMR